MELNRILVDRDKAKKVIESVKTSEQIDAAENYVKLFYKKWSDNKNFKELIDTTNAMLNKELELLKNRI